ncbi:M phase phosphoprotein 10 [Ziziphus jujuba]|uniref:U3 small nucleolar ribonucleoprotein protein MPP10 n=1 Tax=Ziziphus jujuba TaxID=326968 RepID=A0A6P3ZPD8_ZIZJJ|nr:M phase phosphoprotein 10 [Ziziphus jujuba]
MATTSEAGLEALHRLRETDPAQWLTEDSTIKQTARAASQQLFSSLRPFAPKSPFDQLLVDGFDVEQIWQQIDLQTQPLLSNLRRELKRFEKNPEEIKKLKLVGQGQDKVLEEERDGFDEDLDDFDVDDDVDEDEDEDDEEGGEERENEREEEEEEEEGNAGEGIEDKFLKIKDLEEFLETDEAKEYGLKKKGKKTEDNKQSDDGLEDEDEEEDGHAEESEDEDDEDSDENGEFGFGDDEEDETDELGNARYEDFFGGKKKKPSKKSKLIDNSEDSATDDEEGDQIFENQKQKNLSKHEKEQNKLKSEIEQMENANLGPKDWTMQGEVTAAKRPKNSALEVDLDFQHNVRPPPVITEEITESLENMIKQRIANRLFDDVQKAPTLPSKAPKEIKELDENKSNKGLAEVYEEKYVQETNPAYAPPSFTDELKTEASTLFKKLCLKLDALSHFHFSPKPVIEDMAVQVNVPALAMEEIAPVAVSDAAMLAPEEVFAGKGDVKEEAELTQADRKRRRAKKKRKFKAKAAKRKQNYGQDNTLQTYDDGKENKKLKL